MKQKETNVKPIAVLKGMGWIDRAYFLFFIASALALIFYGVYVAGLNGLFIIVGALFLYCFYRLYLQNRNRLVTRRQRKKEESKTLAKVSPEWEKIRSEIDEIRGRLAKDLLKNRLANPQQGLFRDIFKKGDDQ